LNIKYNLRDGMPSAILSRNPKFNKKLIGLLKEARSIEYAVLPKIYLYLKSLPQTRKCNTLSISKINYNVTVISNRKIEITFIFSKALDMPYKR
jgi:hypothetical protein